ncbi:MAG: tyrosine-type recombinase/integrase [Deltaproteobacteria bacterium]|nr:tyrosine-type recombinase/integrase [Deltaproteobacteria bacterium]
MNIEKLTDSKLRSLKPQNKRYRITVKSHQGLILVIEPSGKIKFSFRYKSNNSRREITLGSYPSKSLKELNKLHADMLERVENGADPLLMKEEQKQADDNDPLFSVFCERYLEEYAEPKLKPKTVAEYRRQIDKHLFPAMGKMKLSKITFRQIDKLITSLAKDKPILANRVLALTKGVFTFAVKKRLIQQNPAALYEPPAKERPKDRYLSMDEIKALWLFMTEGADRDCSDAVKLILLTGCRPGEIINLTMKEIDERADGKWVALSADRTKNKQPHQAYLSPLAAEIIQKRLDDGLVIDSLLFPAESTSRKTGKMRIVSMRGDVLTHKVTRLLRDLKGAGIEVEKFAAHDLRRTCATHVARIGYAATVPEILNHKQRSVTRAVYDQYDRLPEIRRALEAWSLTIERELRGCADNVVPMTVGQNGDI